MFKKVMIGLILVAGLVFAQDALNENTNKNSSISTAETALTINGNVSVLPADNQRIETKSGEFTSANDLAVTGQVNLSAASHHKKIDEGLRNVCTCCTLLFVIYLITALI